LNEMTDKEWLIRVSLIMLYDYGVKEKWPWMKYHTLHDSSKFTPEEWAKDRAEEMGLKLLEDHLTIPKGYWKGVTGGKE